MSGSTEPANDLVPVAVSRLSDLHSAAFPHLSDNFLLIIPWDFGISRCLDLRFGRCPTTVDGEDGKSV